MSDSISFTAQLCNAAGQACETVLMKIELAELARLQSAQFSQADMAQWWAMSFTATLSLWFIAKVVGMVLQVIKRG